MSSTLRMAAIDYSHGHQYSYTNSMAGLPMIDFVALADQDAERRARAEALVSGLGLTDVDVYADYHDLLARPDIDAVVICSPNASHHKMTLDAARAGKHVLCEKPLALTVSEAQEMIGICEEEGVFLGTAYPCRFSPVMWDMKEALENGEIGALVSMSATNHLGAIRHSREPNDWLL